MIEVVVRRGERTVFTLPIDEKWKNELLSKFVSQLVDSIFSEASVDAAHPSDKTQHNDIERNPTPSSDEPSILDPPRIESFSYASSPIELRRSDYKVTDADAIGRKQLMRYKGNRITGNMFATLKALEDAGGSVEIADDLESVIRIDQRFDLDLKNDTIRAQLRSLVKMGLVEEVSQSARSITPTGSEIAKLFPIIPVQASVEQHYSESPEDAS